MEWIETAWSNWIGHIVTLLIGGGIGGLSIAYLRLRGGVSEIRRKERADVEQEWERQVKRLNNEIDRLNTLGTNRDVKIDKLTEENLKCHTDYAELKAQHVVYAAEAKVRDERIASLTTQVSELVKAAQPR